jgi:hypothetical protein
MLTGPVLRAHSYCLQVLPKSRITFALVSVLVVGLMVACGSDERNGVRTKTGASGDDNQASAGPAGQWQVLAKAEEGWYRPEGIFWDDDRLLVVAASTIMAWDPENDSWQVLARIPQADECEGCGYSETAVWTGEELLLWGGGFSYKTPTAAYAGAAFNPKMSKLRPLPDAPIPSRWWHTAVWSGAEMIVWGGSDGRHERRDGAAYNPRTDSWRRIADAPMGGYAHSVVWTGEEMIVWGGVSASNNGAYDPDTDSWREISHGPLSGRVEHSAVWTGEEMIVWGGSVVGGGPGYEDGAAYDPVQNFWAELPPAPIASRFRHAAIWNGVAMIVWGGQRVGGGGAGSFSDGASYRP